MMRADLRVERRR